LISFFWPILSCYICLMLSWTRGVVVAGCPRSLLREHLHNILISSSPSVFFAFHFYALNYFIHDDELNSMGLKLSSWRIPVVIAISFVNSLSILIFVVSFVFFINVIIFGSICFLRNVCTIFVSLIQLNACVKSTKQKNIDLLHSIDFFNYLTDNEYRIRCGSVISEFLISNIPIVSCIWFAIIFVRNFNAVWSSTMSL